MDSFKSSFCESVALEFESSTESMLQIMLGFLKLAHKGLLKPRVAEKGRELVSDIQLYYSPAV